MLTHIDAVATVAVNNLETARAFYEGVLGLEPVDFQGDEVIVFKSGNTSLNVYRSRYAGTNQATAVTWMVPDAEREVRELAGKGVRFEHYDMPGLSRQGDVHTDGGMKIAWFKDPDGNIHNLFSR